MAYDEDLANRLREQLADEEDVTEKQMFGGLAFLVGGRMAVAVSGSGGLMARVDPAQTDELRDREHVGPMVMQDREVDGWLRVADAGIDGDAQLREWVQRGVAFAKTLP